jgi:type I restriction enzyme, S subunit
MVDLLSGYAFESERFADSGDLPVVRIRDVVPGHSSTFYRGEYDEKFLVRDGEILIGMDGEFNRARWGGGTALLNQRVCRIASSSGDLDQGYLYHFLPAALEAIERVTPFVTVKHLSVKQVRDIKIPLPPLSEQQRIAKVLDWAEALRAKRHAAVAQLNTLTQAIFFDHFGLPNVSRSKWPIATLGEVCQKITDGTHHSPSIQRAGVPYVTAKHLKEYGLDFYSDPWFVSAEDHRAIFARCDPKPGDVLYIKDGATTGIAAVNHYEFEFSMLSSLALLRPRQTQLLNAYLCHWLNNPVVKRELLGGMAGVAIRRLTLEKLKAVRLPVPPIQLQEAFSQRVLVVEKLKVAYTAFLSKLDSLFASLQNRAFRGEL